MHNRQHHYNVAYGRKTYNQYVLRSLFICLNHFERRVQDSKKDRCTSSSAYRPSYTSFRLPAKAITESKRLEEEKNAINEEITALKVLLSNTLTVVSINAKDNVGKVLAEMMSICCICIRNESDRILYRYESLKRNLLATTPIEKEIIAQHKHNLKNIHIPNDIEHYTEIMKLHIEILDILENANRH